MNIKTFKAKISELKPTQNNPRQIKKDDFEILKRSLKDFPQMREIREVVVDEDMRVLGGHQRIKALEAIGEKEVPVKQVFGLTEAQKKEFIIKDNISNGEWDMDILANEWDEESLEEWGLDINIEPKESNEIEADFASCKIEIECEDEAQQEALFEELTERGLKCKTV